MTAPRVLALVGGTTGCELWRVFQPFAELSKQGYPAEWIWRTDDRLGEYVPLFDAVVLCRLSWQPQDEQVAVRWIDLLHRLGKAVIYEVDDDLFTARNIVAQQLGSKLEDRPAEELERDAAGRLFAMRLCDGVTTTTQRLATVLRQYTDKPVCVVPNAIDLPWWQAVQALVPRKKHPVTIGWAGGRRPERDLVDMAVAWGRIAERYPEVRFRVQGYMPDVIAEHVPKERIEYLPWMKLQEYPLGLVGVDIGCCPLDDTAFNRAKSPIKAMEYAASGAAVVASPTVYGNLISPPTSTPDGYIADTTAGWEWALDYFITNPGSRRRQARRLLEKVKRHHTLERNAWRWSAAWAEIVEAFRARQAASRLVMAGR